MKKKGSLLDFLVPKGPSRPPKHVTGLPVDEPVEIRWDCVGIMNKALGGVEIPFVLGV